MIFQTSFYSLSITNADGNTIALSAHQGKKVLLVNIATGSQHVNQLAGLQQLQQLYGDSVAVIAFPSNSFGNETRTNTEIKQFCQSEFNSTFTIAALNPVSGSGIQSVYQWLFDIAMNGDASISVQGDFQKILIDTDGVIIGVYAPSVSPTDPTIVHAITTAQH